MNWHAFKERFRYNYKKYCAIVFSSLATALLLASAVIYVVEMIAYRETPSILTPINVYNLAFMLVAYLVILIGNINSSNSAYNGVLIYIFASAFSAVINLFFGGAMNFSSLFSGDPLGSSMALVQLAFNVFGVVAGIFAYIRLRQYLTGSSVSYTNVRNWNLAFVVFQIVSSSFLPGILLLDGASGLNVLMSCLYPISEILICLGIYFTVLRLRSY
ncbi:MAG: hypothetical protein LKK13_00320 [Bacilli bacterium]|jgi:hypothetical protein|nr:hypothetical protein [Bacilli bacterium]